MPNNYFHQMGDAEIVDKRKIKSDRASSIRSLSDVTRVGSKVIWQPQMFTGLESTACLWSDCEFRAAG